MSCAAKAGEPPARPLGSRTSRGGSGLVVCKPPRVGSGAGAWKAHRAVMANACGSETPSAAVGAVGAVEFDWEIISADAMSAIGDDYNEWAKVALAQVELENEVPVALLRR